MAKIWRGQIGVKMKKISTIRKEEMKLRKFLVKNMGLYSKDLKMQEKLNQVLIADAMLIWIMGNCKWTPSTWLKISERNKK